MWWLSQLHLVAHTHRCLSKARSAASLLCHLHQERLSMVAGSSCSGHQHDDSNWAA